MYICISRLIIIILLFRILNKRNYSLQTISYCGQDPNDTRYSWYLCRVSINNYVSILHLSDGMPLCWEMKSEIDREFVESCLSIIGIIIQYLNLCVIFQATCITNSCLLSLLSFFLFLLVVLGSYIKCRAPMGIAACCLLNLTPSTLFQMLLGT